MDQTFFFHGFLHAQLDLPQPKARLGQGHHFPVDLRLPADGDLLAVGCLRRDAAIKTCDRCDRWGMINGITPFLSHPTGGFPTGFLGSSISHYLLIAPARKTYGAQRLSIDIWVAVVVAEVHATTEVLTSCPRERMPNSEPGPIWVPGQWPDCGR